MYWFNDTFIRHKSGEKQIDLTLSIYILLTALGFVAGFVNAIAGGAGTVVLPVMIWLGIPPLNAIATGKLQAIIATVVSISRYFSGGFVAFRPCGTTFVFTALQEIADKDNFTAYSNHAGVYQAEPDIQVGQAEMCTLKVVCSDEDITAKEGSKNYKQ